MIVYKIPYKGEAESLHSKLLKGLKKRLDLCADKRTPLDDRTDHNEKRCALYRKTAETDRDKRRAKAQGKSEYNEVIVPYSYALMVSAHAYMVNVFMQKDPVIAVQGLQDEGQMKELALETLLRYQYTSGDMAKHFMIWLLDPCRFGYGILGSFWAENEKVITKLEEFPVEVNGVVVEGKTEQRFSRQVVKGYSGNKVFNVHPKSWIFDPRVPMHAIQDMEFVGRHTSISIMEALDRQERGEYFNVDKVIDRLTDTRFPEDNDNDVDRVLNKLTGDSKVEKENKILDTPLEGKTGNIALVELSVTLIPTQWGISKSGNRPEKWHFTIANEKYIVCAYPQGTAHQEHPFHLLEMELDGYRQDSRSLVEVAEPMNEVLSWMFNSHMWNKRASMNNQFVYDPLRVEENDVKSNKAGKLIRLKATAYGTDVRSAIHQLPVADVTANSMQDAMLVEKMMQRQLGTNEDVAGGSSQSSRRSATEFNATTGFSMSRLNRDALHFSITGIQSLGRHLISNSQQFYTGKQKLKIGGYTGVLEEVVEVTPEQIAGNFDVVPADGTMPISRMQQANFWKEVLLGMGQIPEVRQMYRLEDIFAHMGRLGGLMNIEKFRVEPDEKVKRMAEMGLIENVTGNAGTAGVASQPAPGAGGGETPMGGAQSPTGVPAS